MNDTVFVHGLKAETVIGIWEWERKIRQTVIIDLDMSVDASKGAANDSVEETLDYSSVAQRILQYAAESDFQLVETLAERIAAIIRGEFGVAWVRVKINKPGAVRGARDVGVIIERGTRQ